MTANEFIWWLAGYLDAKFVISDNEKAEIRERMKKVFETPP